MNLVCKEIPPITVGSFRIKSTAEIPSAAGMELSLKFDPAAAENQRTTKVYCFPDKLLQSASRARGVLLAQLSSKSNREANLTRNVHYDSENFIPPQNA